MTRTATATMTVCGGLAFCAAALTRTHEPVVLARLALLGAALAGVVASDLTERRIPNRLVLPATAGCAALTLAAGDAGRVAAAGVIVLVLGTVALARLQALGMGDVKLALLIACGLDGKAAAALILGLTLAALAGLLLAVRHGRHALHGSLPLAPFLALGAIGALFA